MVPAGRGPCLNVQELFYKNKVLPLSIKVFLNFIKIWMYDYTKSGLDNPNFDIFEASIYGWSK
jgi:hypothetical protein